MHSFFVGIRNSLRNTCHTTHMDEVSCCGPLGCGCTSCMGGFEDPGFGWGWVGFWRAKTVSSTVKTVIAASFYVFTANVLLFFANGCAPTILQPASCTRSRTFFTLKGEYMVLLVACVSIFIAWSCFSHFFFWVSFPTPFFHVLFSPGIA